MPATLSSRVRLLGSGRSNKNDANDARAVAVAALRAPSLAVVRVEDHVSVLRLLAKAQLDISHARSRACSRLHALVSELVAGGIGKEVVVNQGEAAARHDPPGERRATPTPRAGARAARRDPCPRRPTQEHPSGASADAVAASGTSLTEIYGVGPIIAAIVIGYTGDIARFPSAGHYAAYNGTAPIEFSSSGRTVHRLSRRGNRTLNHAMHMIAVTQIRNPGSEGRAYYDAKLAAGRTRREAMRALKRHISDRVYRHLRADARGR